MSEVKRVVIEVKNNLADVLEKPEGVEVVIVDKDDDITLTYKADETVNINEV